MAARFQFRLESLLRVRKALEEEAKRHLSRTIGARDRAQAQVEAVRTARQGALDNRQTAPHQRVDLDLWRATERYLLVMERRIQLAVDEVRQAEAVVEAARAALLKAHQDHLILQRLKERRQEQHALEVLHEETRDMDEIAVLRHAITHPAVS